MVSILFYFKDQPRTNFNTAGKLDFYVKLGCWLVLERLQLHRKSLILENDENLKISKINPKNLFISLNPDEGKIKNLIPSHLAKIKPRN